jgi:hypothetical protein
LIVSDNLLLLILILLTSFQINIDARGNPILNKEGSQTYQTWYDFDGTKYFTFGKALKATIKLNNSADDFLVESTKPK